MSFNIKKMTMYKNKQKYNGTEKKQGITINTIHEYNSKITKNNKKI